MGDIKQNHFLGISMGRFQSDRWNIKTYPRCLFMGAYTDVHDAATPVLSMTRLELRIFIASVPHLPVL